MNIFGPSVTASLSTMSERFAPENDIIDILTAEEVEPDWLIPNLFAQGTMVVLGGEPGTGKSYVSYTLSLAIAAGVKALSGIVPAREPKRVLYFDEENSPQDRNKYLQRSFNGLGGLKTKRNQSGLAADALQDNFWAVHFHLGNDDWVDRAAEWVDFVRPHLMVFDTATPCFAIGDENENAEATQAMKGVRQLMRMTDPHGTSLILKHAKIRSEKGGRRTLRGAKAWQSGADAVLFQVRAPGRPRDGLNVTRLVPDKVRAYGLPQTLYITPEWTDDERTGLRLLGSYQADSEHRAAERLDDGEDD